MQRSPEGDADSAPSTASAPPPEFAVPGQQRVDYTDGRPPGVWESKYPKPARCSINYEACVLGVFLLLLSLSSGWFLGLSSQSLQVPITWPATQAGAPVLAARLTEVL
jgi:hypothetical protein